MISVDLSCYRHRNAETFAMTKHLRQAIRGVARLLDLGVQMDKRDFSMSPAERDARAIGRDWQRVGNDLRNAIEESKSERSAGRHVRS
jgi:hypothetical protein